MHSVIKTAASPVTAYNFYTLTVRMEQFMSVNHNSLAPSKKKASPVPKKKGNSSKVCPNCGRKMRQQFIGLQHCKCGMSWIKGEGFFERSGDMVFALERREVGKKIKQCPVIRYRDAYRRNLWALDD